jgi:hypothetical protein
VALALVFARTAEGYALVDGAVVADNGGFAYDNAHSVIYKKSFTNGCAGMNLNSRKKSGGLRDKTRHKEHFMPVKKVCKSVIDNGVKS